MKLMTWKHFKTSTGKPVSKAELTPFPIGPYLLCSQFDERAYEGMSYKTVLESHRDKLVDRIPNYTWGKVAFAFDENGEAYKCFYHYDTSD